MSELATVWHEKHSIRPSYGYLSLTSPRAIIFLVVIDMKKRIPYGIGDFETIRKDNYYYVDKTKIIKELEKL